MTLIPEQEEVRRAPTLRVIAEKAGVSAETVSHILGKNLSGRYKESTRLKVIEIAKELNYRPHRGAQTMKAGRSNLIAIVHFGAGIEAADKTNLALSRLVHKTGYDYLAIDMNWYEGSIERMLAELIRARVEGVLVSHIQEVFRDEHLVELQRVGIAVVSINGGRRKGVPLICDNVERAFLELTQHLMTRGCRRIVQLISSSSHLAPGRARTISDRVNGFRKGLGADGSWQSVTEAEFFKLFPEGHAGADGGVCGVTVLQDPRLYDQMDKPAYRFCSRLFQMGNLPDAIVCMNDAFAMEVIAAALEHGVRIPGDVAVTGYDNDRLGELPAFGITTAEQDTQGICTAAVDILMNLIKHSDHEAVDQLFDSRIITRGSTGGAGLSRRSRSSISNVRIP